MKRTLRSILALTLAIFSMLGSLSALAETVCVMQSATVYATPGDASSAVGTLPAGTVLTRDAAKSGWSRVRQGGNTAFMRSEDLTVPKACKVTAYAQSETALYRSFTEDSDKLATISAGSTVLVAATAGEWGYAQSNGKTGFVKLSALTTDAPKADAPDSSVQTMNVTAYASKDGAKVYNAKGKALGSVPLNTAVTVKAVRDNLCLVERCGVTAVMYASDLSTGKTEVSQDSGVTTISPKTYYVSSDGAKVYSGSGKVIATLPLNFAVTVDAYTDTLARVSANGSTGFMLKTDLTDTKPAETPAVTEISPKTYYVLNNGAKVADASGRELGTLSAGTAVTVDAYTDTLARVSANGSTGFMLKTDLTDTKPAQTLQYGDKGEAVEKVQSRLLELGYFTGSVGGNYLDLTKSAVAAFQSAAKLNVTGIVDAQTLAKMFADDAPKAPRKDDSGSANTGTTTARPATGTAVEADWWKSDIQSIYARGTTATVTDVETGIAWNEYRGGGTNHADVQPATAADTANMKKACGSWSWKRRAIFVTINGVNYAASMNCMPHGSGSIKDNNFNGHHCIHFTNSRTHGSNKVCSLHQAAIKKALNATL